MVFEEIGKFFSNILDFIFGPLLLLPAFVSVLIMSLIISVIIVIIYKYTTDQKLMKQLKDEMKEYQNKMKEMKNQPEKMMEVQKKSMEVNMKYMMQSFRSTLFTFIPIILIFSWMNAHYAYEPINPDEPFQLVLTFAKDSMGNVSLYLPEGISALSNITQEVQNDKVVFELRGGGGQYFENRSIKLEYNKRTFFKDLIITNDMKYTPKDTPIKDSNLRIISVEYRKKIILPGLNWGWLGTYILLSIVFSIALRKVLNVH